MAEQEAAGKGVTEEQLLAMSKDAAVLERGAAVFKQTVSLATEPKDKALSDRT